MSNLANLTSTAAVKLSSSEVFAPQIHKETGACGDDDIWEHGDVPPGDYFFWGVNALKSFEREDFLFHPVSF